MQEQGDEVEQTAAALIDEANNDEAVDKSVDVDTDADAEEENVKETSEKTEELETDDMQEESGVVDIVENM